MLLRFMIDLFSVSPIIVKIEDRRFQWLRILLGILMKSSEVLTFIFRL